MSGRVIAAVALVLLLSGCGRSVDPRRAAVCGKILLDGEPVPQGSITFFPVERNKGPAAGGTFQKGRYNVSRAAGPMVGKHRVEIRAAHNTGRKIPAPTGELIDEYVELVPDQYNTQSTLEIDVRPGKNVFDFDLKSQ